MAISDKVIDLAPVNKTKNIILYIALGLLVALSAVFIVLFAIKPSVTPVQVNAVTITKNDLYPIDGAYTATNTCVYTLDAQVGVTGDVKSTLAWTYSPSGVLYDLNEQEEQVEDENGNVIPVSRFRFRVAGDVGQKVTVTATSTVDSSKYTSVEFTIVEGVAGDMSLTSITGNGKTSELRFDEAQQAYTTDALPYYKTAPEGYRTYTVAVAQLGLGGVAQMGDKNNVVKAESSDNGVINILGCTDKEVRFRVVGTGDVDLTVTANAANSGDAIVKKLKLSARSTDSLDIISKFYLYPNGGVPAEKPDYDALDKVKPIESLTLYIGDKFVLEDHLLVRPFTRMNNLDRNIKIETTDGNIVRQGDKNNKKTLDAVKAGRVEVTISDTSSANAGAKLKLSVEVRIKVQKIEVSGATASEGVYKRNAYRSQQNGSIPLLYTFDAVAATFDNTYTDCDLTVYAYEGNALAAKPYDNKGAVKFPKLEDGVIPVSNANVIKDKMQITAGIGFTVDGNAAVTKYRYRFIAGAVAAGGGSNYFDIEFNITTEPKGIQWVDSIAPGAGIAQFLSLKQKGDKDAMLTINLNTPSADSVSVADLLQFTDSEGNVDDAAKSIGLERIRLETSTNACFSIGDRKPENKIEAKETDNEGRSYITVRLFTDEKKTTELASIKLYVKVVDHDKTAAVGTLKGSAFTPFTGTVSQEYRSDTSFAYNKQSIKLSKEGFSLFSHTWGDQYESLKAGEYSVRIRLTNGDWLTEKDGRYYATESAATAGADALFEFKDGDVYVLQDFFILRNVYKGADYSSFTVHYYLVRDGVTDEEGCSVSYNLIREVQEIKLYTDGSFATEEHYDATAKKYKLEKNQGETVDMYVGGVFAYANGENASQTLVLPVEDIAAQKDAVHTITQGAITNGIATAVNDTLYNTRFTLKSGITSGGSETGSISYNCDKQSLTIEITVRNMSAPVQSIKLYTDAAKQNEFAATEESRYTLKSNETLKLYFDIVYSGGTAYLNYEPVYFVLDQLRIDLKDGATDLEKFEITDSKPGATDYTVSGVFEIGVTGNSNGDARWTLSTPSGKTQTYYFYITTLMQSENAVEVKYDDKTVYSASSDTLALTLTGANDKPQKELRFKFISADAHDPQFPVDKTQYTFSSVSANSLFTANHNMNDGTIVLQSVGKIGTDTVTLTFTEAGTNKTYTVTLNVTVTADVYALHVMQDETAVESVHLNALGADADEWNKVAFGVRFNGGNADRQPEAADKNKLTVGLQREVGDEWQAATTTDLKIVATADGYELQFKNMLTKLDGNYRIEVKCGDVTAYATVTLSSSAYVVKFDNARADIFKTGTYNGFTAKIYPVNGSTAVAVPDGYALTYTLTDLSGNALSSGLATVDTNTGAVTVTGASGSFLLVATLNKSDAAKVHATAQMQIDVNNLVYYIVNNKDFPNRLNGNDEILLIKGNTLDLTEYIGLQSFDHGTPYGGADFTVASSAAGLTVSGKTITATTAGTYTVTLTADNGGHGKAVTRTITVQVAEPTVSVANATINAIERTAIDCAVTVSNGLSSGTLAVAHQSGESLFDAVLNGTTVKLTLKSGVTLSMEKTETFRVTYTADGQSFYKDFTATVKAEGFVPTFVLQQKLNDSTYTQVTGELDINDTYRFTYTGDASHAATYAITSKPSGATDPTDLQGDFRFGSVGTWKARASVTLFGKTFTSEEATYTVLNRTGIASAVYDSTAFTDANKITTIDGFYTDTPKTIYVALDVSGTSYAFADAVSDPAAYFEITANNDCVKAGAGSYNASAKRYYVAFTVQKAGSVSFYGKAKVNGVWQSAPVATLAVTEPSPNISVTYKGGTVKPGAALNLADSNTLSVTKADASNTLTPSYSYEVIAGDSMVAAKPGANGNTQLTIGTCLPTGGTVKVRVTATYNSGWFKGTTATATFDVPVDGVAAPTISLAESNVTLTADKTSYKIGAAGNAPLPTVTAGAGDNVGAPKFTFVSSNTDIATVATDGTVIIKQKGVRFTITATTTIGTGAWQGYELSAVYTFYVEPRVTFDSGDVTPGETIDLNDFVTITGDAASYKFTATYATSADNVTVANNGLVGGWTAGTATVNATITITEGDLVGFTFTRSASFTVLALSVTDLTVEPGASGQTLTANIGGTEVAGVVWTTDSDLITISDNIVSAAENANMIPEGGSGTAKTAYVFATCTVDEKIYKAKLQVTVPAKAVPNPTVKVGETPITGGTHTETASVGDEKVVTIDTADSGYSAAAYNTPFVVDGEGIFSVNVTKTGNVYSVRLLAQHVTESSTVRVQYTVHGYTYTAVALTVKVESGATADSATLGNSPYTDLTGVAAKQIATGSSYTYTFATPSGSFRYFTIEKSDNVSIRNVKSGNSTLELYYGLYDTQRTADSITFEVYATSAGTATITVKAAGSRKWSYGGYTLSGTIVSASASLTVMANGFTTGDITLDSTKAVKVGESCNVTPVPANDFVFDAVKYALVGGGNDFTVDVNGNVAKRDGGHGTASVQVTAYAAGKAQQKTVAVTFYDRPTATLDYTGYTPTLTVMQNGATVATGYSTSYAINTTVYGTINATSGQFTATPQTSAGVVRVTATVTYNSVPAYGNLTLTATDDITVGKAAEPSITVSVNASTKVVTVTASAFDLNSYIFTTSNPNVSVVQDGTAYKLVNSSTETATDVTVTVLARCNSGVYAGQWFRSTNSNAVTVEGIAPPETEPTLSAAQSGQTIDITNSGDWTNIRLFSDNAAVTVENVGGAYTLKNATLQAQSATITVIAEYNKAGSNFIERTYVATVSVTVAADAESPMSAAASDGQITVTHDERLSQLGAVTYEYVVSDADKPYIEIGKNGAYTVKPGDTDKTVTVTVNVLVGGSQHGAALSVTIAVSA